MKTTSIRKGDVIMLPCSVCATDVIWKWSNEPYKILTSRGTKKTYIIKGIISGEERYLRYVILQDNEISPCDHGVHIKKLNKSEQDLYKISL